jgi:hypothetical protein
MTATTPRSLGNEYLQPFAAAGDMSGARQTLLYLYRLHLEKWRLVAEKYNK